MSGPLHTDIWHEIIPFCEILSRHRLCLVNTKLRSITLQNRFWIDAVQAVLDRQVSSRYLVHLGRIDVSLVGLGIEDELRRPPAEKGPLRLLSFMVWRFENTVSEYETYDPNMRRVQYCDVCGLVEIMESVIETCSRPHIFLLRCMKVINALVLARDEWIWDPCEGFRLLRRVLGAVCSEEFSETVNERVPNHLFELILNQITCVDWIDVVGPLYSDFLGCIQHPALLCGNHAVLTKGYICFIKKFQTLREDHLSKHATVEDARAWTKYVLCILSMFPPGAPNIPAGEEDNNLFSMITKNVFSPLFVSGSVVMDPEARRNLSESLPYMRGYGCAVLLRLLKSMTRETQPYAELFISQPEILRCLRDTRDVCYRHSMERCEVLTRIARLAHDLHRPVEKFYSHPDDPNECLTALLWGAAVCDATSKVAILAILARVEEQTFRRVGHALPTSGLQIVWHYYDHHRRY